MDQLVAKLVPLLVIIVPAVIFISLFFLLEKRRKNKEKADINQISDRLGSKS